MLMQMLLYTGAFCFFFFFFLAGFSGFLAHVVCWDFYYFLFILQLRLKIYGENKCRVLQLDDVVVRNQAV